MLIVEVSKRRIIAIVTDICFMLSSCFSVLSGTIYAFIESLGKQGKDIPENMQGDVYQEENNALTNCFENNCVFSLNLGKNEQVFDFLNKEIGNSNILVTYILNNVLTKPLTVS